MKKVIIMFVFVCITAAAFLPGCNKKDDNAPVVDTIYIGTHGIGSDPRWRDPITGEPSMSSDRMYAGEKALQVVREELGVDIQWRTWPHSAVQDCLQTVLAGDPICHVAHISTGSLANVLSQNVLQPLERYMDVFEDPDTQWMVLPKVFGNYYYLNGELLFLSDWPLCFNVNMIEEVPALKDENGKTIYPYDLYKEGKWTWSVFRDYLQKIQAYYRGRKSPFGRDIATYDTNYMHILQMALHSGGAHIYDGNSLNIDSPEAIAAAEFLTDMFDNELITCSTAVYGRDTNPGGTSTNNRFINSESVFTNCARWRMGEASNSLVRRGESLGIIFFPRSDDIPYEGDYVPGQTKYSLVKPACDSDAILKGFSEEETRLALEAFRTYTMEYYKALGRVDTIAEYREKNLESQALEFGLDIFHPRVGDHNLAVFKMLGDLPFNEFGEVMNLFGPYNIEIFGKSVYGVDGSPKYATAVRAKKDGVYAMMENMSRSLQKKGAIDAAAPDILQKNQNVPIVFPKGTKPGSIDWSEIISVSDNVDGAYEFKEESGEYLLRAIKPDENDGEEESAEAEFEKGRMSIDFSGVNFNEAGKYDEQVEVKVTDTYGNTGTRKFSVYIYDEENTQPPVLVLKDELPPLPVNTDTSTVEWSKLFVEKAEDTTGIDLKSFVSADVCWLDVTVPGVYPVTIYVTDFAGNRTEVETNIEIVK